MKKALFLCATIILMSCASSKIVNQVDITDKSSWLESSIDNPIVNVIQKQYANDDIEIVIKKKFTTDYIKIMLRKDKRVINKKTIRNKSK